MVIHKSVISEQFVEEVKVSARHVIFQVSFLLLNGTFLVVDTDPQFSPFSNKTIDSENNR